MQGAVQGIVLSVFLLTAASAVAGLGFVGGASALTAQFVQSGELRWTEGQPLPEVNGRVVPPATAVKFNPSEPSPPAINCHPACYYFGSMDGNWFSSLKTSVQVDLLVPYHSADPSDSYYVVLSIVDNHNSYDQIGLYASYYGWTAVHSYSSDVCGNTQYYYDPYWKTLTPGNTYTFKMTISGGFLNFYVIQYGSTLVSYSVATAATGFVETEWFYCNPSKVVADYTDYEEVFTISSSMDTPTWSFFFTNNMVDGAPFTSWTHYNVGNPPGQVDVRLSGSSITIVNQYFGIFMDTQTLWVPYGSTSASWTGKVTLVDVYGCGSCQVASFVSRLPGPGWSASTGPGGIPPFSFSSTIYIPSGTSTGTYTIDFMAKRLDGLYWTTYTGTINIYSGGGGCVARGTPILTPTGYVNVEKLRPGDAVVGYDLATSSVVILTLRWANSTRERDLVNINGGMLLVTAEDQPIFVRNDTFVGWLRDPKDLHVGDLVFSPTDGSWIPVTSLAFVDRMTTVFDVVTSGPNTFIANGVLLDMK